jgi:hypothetical protein
VVGESPNWLVNRQFDRRSPDRQSPTVHGSLFTIR